MKPHFKAGDIRRQTGLSKASVARLAKNGQIPGAWRVDGVHYGFTDSPQLQSWIAVQKAKRKMQDSWRFRKNLRSNENNKGTGHLLLESIQNDFLRWRSRSDADGFPNWKNAKLHKVTDLLAPFVEAFRAAAGELQARGESNPAIRKLMPRA
jgi:hypothetical protein